MLIAKQMSHLPDDLAGVFKLDTTSPLFFHGHDEFTFYDEFEKNRKKESVRMALNYLYLKAKENKFQYLVVENRYDLFRAAHIAGIVNEKLPGMPRLDALMFIGPFATFALMFDEQGTIFEAAPVAKWTIGKKIDYCIHYFSGKGFHAVTIPKTAPRPLPEPLPPPETKPLRRSEIQQDPGF